jgi:hypothetical protein
MDEWKAFRMWNVTFHNQVYFITERRKVSKLQYSY